MTASDGSFSSSTESVKARLYLSGLKYGTHTIYVHGKDAAGNWGTTTSIVIKTNGGDEHYGYRNDD
jgi:hypothetical protein